MMPELMNRVFEPFFTTGPVGQGSGMKPSQVYGFVRQSDASVRLESAVGERTTVRLYLPCHMAQVGPFVGGEPTVTSSIRSTVLLVDDEETVRTLIADTLRDHGLTVLEAEDGTLALRILQSSVQIDLLLSDVGLPGVNGRQLAEVARRERPDMPVMLITGYAGPALREGALPEGAELILKPFSLPILLARVSNALAASRR